MVHLDTSSLLICDDSKTNDDTQQSSTIIADLLTDVKNLNEEMKITTKQDLIEFEKEFISTINHEFDQHEQMNVNNNNNSTMIIDPCNLNSLSSSSSLLLLKSSSSSPASLPATGTNGDKTIELLQKEIEEGKKEEEQSDDDNIHVEKKNKCNVEHNHNYTSGIILINDESTPAVLLEQEKKEDEDEQEKERPMLVLEQTNSELDDDKSMIKVLPNNSQPNSNMSNILNDDEQYKKVELEEIPDEDDQLNSNNQSIEPIDCILTDDELQIPRQSTNRTKVNNKSRENDPIFSCYQKAMSKLIDNNEDLIKPTNTLSNDLQIPSSTKSTQRLEDDPIALRALKRFELSMNAAMATKPTNDDANLSLIKGKSSWSGSQSAPRKSLENVFKTDSTTSDEQSKPTSLTSQRDAFIRPRKTFDDIGMNLGLSRNLSTTVHNKSTDNNTTISSNNNNNNEHNHKIEEQQPPIAVIENNEKQGQYSLERTICKVFRRC